MKPDYKNWMPKGMILPDAAVSRKTAKNFEYGGSVVPASAAITHKNKPLEIFNLTTGGKCGIVYSVS